LKSLLKNLLHREPLEITSGAAFGLRVWQPCVAAWKWRHMKINGHG